MSADFQSNQGALSDGDAKAEDEGLAKLDAFSAAAFDDKGGAASGSLDSSAHGDSSDINIDAVFGVDESSASAADGGAPSAAEIDAAPRANAGEEYDANLGADYAAMEGVASGNAGTPRAYAGIGSDFSSDADHDDFEEAGSVMFADTPPAAYEDVVSSPHLGANSKALGAVRKTPSLAFDDLSSGFDMGTHCSTFDDIDIDANEDGAFGVNINLASNANEIAASAALANAPYYNDDNGAFEDAAANAAGSNGVDPDSAANDSFCESLMETASRLALILRDAFFERIANNSSDVGNNGAAANDGNADGVRTVNAAQLDEGNAATDMDEGEMLGAVGPPPDQPAQVPAIFGSSPAGAVLCFQLCHMLAQANYRGPEMFRVLFEAQLDDITKLSLNKLQAHVAECQQFLQYMEDEYKEVSTRLVVKYHEQLAAISIGFGLQPGQVPTEPEQARVYHNQYARIVSHLCDDLAIILDFYNIDDIDEVTGTADFINDLKKTMEQQMVTLLNLYSN
ncbi:uncharacterized protein LOC115627923 [Scaptodrosophila lebanonensis]|uniref:Uncharacterized protein LOC115627923 n=1 Tax=Drosophila lebanonensis TaxID=7225 RepID=A0A6J2TXP6_DROLE|nr:uncharacterized protein LOC115627923 [Scaptodrosophila lebanonensis]